MPLSKFILLLFGDLGLPFYDHACVEQLGMQLGISVTSAAAGRYDTRPVRDLKPSTQQLSMRWIQGNANGVWRADQLREGRLIGISWVVYIKSPWCIWNAIMSKTSSGSWKIWHKSYGKPVPFWSGSRQDIPLGISNMTKCLCVGNGIRLLESGQLNQSSINCSD